ncbi:MAG: UDP-2,3-diacylglucosamine diphosphatase [Burkholderiaceae bacterium]
MTSTVPPFAQLVAPQDWRTVDFISDLHLTPAQPATFAALQRYLAGQSADALFILGDFFEVWVGDDAADGDGFARDCATLLRSAAQRTAVYFMRGNRDFLVGDVFLRQCHAKLLNDPAILDFDGRRWLLTHGDALCLDDSDYMQFRQQVRTTQWRDEFLARPLAQREAIARQMRDASEQRKRSGVDYADLNAEAVRDWLQAAQAPVMIHGHTHKPAQHEMGLVAGVPMTRIVLSDWDGGATPPRQQVLRLTLGQPGGPQRIELR